MTDTHLGHYRVEAHLYVGSKGSLYRATDTVLDREVTLRILGSEWTAVPEFWARFCQEIKVLTLLDRPNIARIYGIEEHEEARFLVMELVEGKSLEEKMRQGGLTLKDALSICGQIASALQSAHEEGFIHGDLKPRNVQIGSGEEVKLLDFGMVNAMATALRTTMPGQLVEGSEIEPEQMIGNPTPFAYRSPENIRGKPADKLNDVWAFGCVLFDCLVGHWVTSRSKATSMVGFFPQEPDLGKLPRPTPRNICVLLRRCLEKDPRKRLQSLEEAEYEMIKAAKMC